MVIVTTVTIAVLFKSKLASMLDSISDVYYSRLENKLYDSIKGE